LDFVVKSVFFRAWTDLFDLLSNNKRAALAPAISSDPIFYLKMEMRSAAGLNPNFPNFYNSQRGETAGCTPQIATAHL
jgi:hypothetical protein